MTDELSDSNLAPEIDTWASETPKIPAGDYKKAMIIVQGLVDLYTGKNVTDPLKM